MHRFFSILFLLCVPLLGFTNGKIVSGVVKNSVGEPLPWVEIMESHSQVSALSNETGAFSLKLPEDTIREVEISFSFFGYQDSTLSVRIESDSIFLRVVMKELPDKINQVDVVGIAKQETSVEKLNVDVSKSIPSASGDGVVGMVVTLPGVSSNNELSSQYSVRGGNYDENCVYVNSIEVYRPLLIRSGEQEGLSFVNSDLVESVSFSSGGFSPEYGDKMSSVLDIKYKTPTSFEGSASISFLGASAYVGSSSKRFSQVHGFRYKTSSYMLNSLETEGEYNPRFLDYQTYMTLRVSPKWKLSFLGNLSRNQYDFVPKSRSTNFGTMTNSHRVYFQFDGQEKDLFSTYFGAFTLSCNPSSSLSLDFIGSSFHSAEHVSYDIASSYNLSQVHPDGSIGGVDEGVGSFHEYSRNRFDGTVSNVSHIGTWKQGKNTFKWGLSMQWENMAETVSEWEYRDSAGYSLPSREDHISLYRNLTGDVNMFSHRVSGFAQDSYTLRTTSGRFVFLGGVRFSYWDFNKQLTPSPRASFAWFPAKSSWVFRLATGIYHQAMLFKEVKKIEEVDDDRIVRLNSDVKSPRSSQVILASDYYFRKWGRPFKLTGELYYKYIDRIIPYLVDNMKITYRGENCADGFAFGGDVKLFGEFVPGTDSWISVSMMNTKENVYGDGLGFLPRPTDQRFNVSMFFQDYFPGYEKLKFNLKMAWADGYPVRPPNVDHYVNSLRVSNYFRFDFGVIFQLRKGFDPVMEKKFFSWMKVFAVNLDVFNLLDVKNVNLYYWVPTSNEGQYAVPNYLTGRLFNLRLKVDF
ncbi:MAG: carboxypeptidase-like regulatory domain-containing protein [Paludibacteraceae bacterium]|nr:carboxypeptidase-like regulatory domain-containing protein [Paludibacteraceae bacterium]